MRKFGVDQDGNDLGEQQLHKIRQRLRRERRLTTGEWVMVIGLIMVLTGCVWAAVTMAMEGM